MRVQDIRQAFIELKAKYPNGNRNQTLNLRGVCFIADEPAIFGKPDYGYIERELEWYQTMSRNVYDMEPPIPKIWLNIADHAGYINSNYGYLVHSSDNFDQYKHVLAELRRNPDSRRGIMVLSRPSMHIDSLANGMNDFVCCSTVVHEIEDDKLHTTVNWRSQDAYFGYRNDRPFMQLVQAQLAGDLEVKPGELIWQCASIHVYKRHFGLIPNL